MYRDRACSYRKLTFYLRVVAFLFLIGLGSSALAHATIVFGTLQSEPAVPQPGEPVNLTLQLQDPTEVPVEDAWVLAEFRPEGAPEESEPVSVRFEEAAPGRYEAEVALPKTGTWQLLLRDQTFRQEEAQAELDFPVGTEGGGDVLSFIFPPTATGQQGVATWLVWLVALPVVAGVVVTVLVLRRSPGEEAEAA